MTDSDGDGGFDVIGSSTLSGTIPTGQTVNVDGSGTSVILSIGGAVTVDGTLELSPTTNGYAMVSGGSLAINSGGNLSVNAGRPTTAYLRTPIKNKTGGTVTIAAPTTNQDNNTLTTNQGTFSVSSGGGYTLSGGSSFTRLGRHAHGDRGNDPEQRHLHPVRRHRIGQPGARGGERNIGRLRR